ncbi:hypothetical protein JTB14_018919 [Gonioctena quinquepunctata]|nr:hypothetical protein JTB14_018919 [Gonioctena quinquepunctata]
MCQSPKPNGTPRFDATATDAGFNVYGTVSIQFKRLIFTLFSEEPRIMPENVELQQLVDDEQENELKIYEPRSTCHCPYLGLLLATLSSLFFSLCSVIVKWMTDINPMALAAYRYIGVLLPAIPIVIYRQEKVFPKGKQIMLLMRSFTGTAALMLSFYAFRHMPLADASVIVFSVPVFTGIFARMFLKEPCGLFNIFSVVLTLLE